MTPVGSVQLVFGGVLPPPSRPPWGELPLSLEAQELDLKILGGGVRPRYEVVEFLGCIDYTYRYTFIQGWNASSVTYFS